MCLQLTISESQPKTIDSNEVENISILIYVEAQLEMLSADDKFGKVFFNSILRGVDTRYRRCLSNAICNSVNI